VSLKNKLHRAISETFGDDDIATISGLDLSGLTSITELLPYRDYDEELRVYKNNKSCGFVIEMAPIIGADENVVKTITGLVTDGLPKGTSIQITSWGSRFYGPILERWVKPRLEKGGIHAEIARERVEYLSKAAWSPLSPKTNMVLRNFRTVISVGFAGQLTTARADELLAIRQNLLGTLEGMNVAAINLEPSELMSIVDEWWNADEDDHRDPDYANDENDKPTARSLIPDYLFPKKFEWDPERPIHAQLASGGIRVKAESSRVKLGEHHEARSFTVVGFPEYWAQWMSERLIGHPLNTYQTLKSPYRITLSFRVLDQVSETNNADLKAMKATKDVTDGGATYRPKLNRERKDWQFVADKLKSGQRMVLGIMTVDLIARSSQANDAERALRNLFTSQGWKLERERYVQLPMWLAGFPFTIAEGLMNDLEGLQRTRKLVSWTVANIAPFQGEYKGTRRPHLMLIGRRGQPMTWSPFDNQSGNYNVAVVGKSGAGKSFLLQDLSEGIVADNGRVRIIDDGRSFEKGARMQGGDIIEFSGKNSPEINPFAMISERATREDDKYAVEAQNFLNLVIAQMVKSSGVATDWERGIIAEYTQVEWANNGNGGTPDGVYRRLSEAADGRIKDLGSMMSPFSKDGMFGRFVNKGATIDLSNPLVLFELSDIKGWKEFQSIVLLLCMFSISEEMYRLPRDIMKALFIDEAWDLLHGKGSGDFIEGFVRRCRKYFGSLITGTQSVDDYMKTPAAQASFTNSDYFLLLQQKPESILALKNSGRVDMNERIETMLRSVKVLNNEYSEVAIKGPDIFHVGRLVVDPVSIATYSSKGTEYEQVQRMLDKGMPMMDAVREMADEVRRQRRAS